MEYKIMYFNLMNTAECVLLWGLKFNLIGTIQTDNGNGHNFFGFVQGWYNESTYYLLVSLTT